MKILLAFKYKKFRFISSCTSAVLDLILSIFRCYGAFVRTRQGALQWEMLGPFFARQQLIFETYPRLNKIVVCHVSYCHFHRYTRRKFLVHKSSVQMWPGNNEKDHWMLGYWKQQRSAMPTDTVWWTFSDVVNALNVKFTQLRLFSLEICKRVSCKILIEMNKYLWNE